MSPRSVESCGRGGVEEREKKKEERGVNLDNEVKGTAGQLEKRKKWGVSVEQPWKPSLVRR